MIKNKLFAILFVAVVSLAVGVIIGKFFFGKNKIVKTQPTEISPEIVKPKSLPLLSPITICLKGTGIIMDELSPFRYKLDEYISKAKVKTPNYSISLYFRDLNNGMWHGINYNELFSPSSLMKVPVMIAVLKACEEKKFSLKDKLPYYANNFQGVDDGYGVRKEDGQFYSIEELLDQMIVHSDNIATLMLLHKVELDNVKKVESDINFKVDKNVSGNDNTISVKTYASTFRILYNASYLNQEMSNKALEILSKADFNYGIRASIPEHIKVAHKYGERDYLGPNNERLISQLHHFGIVYYQNKPFLLGFMIKGNNKEKMLQIIEDLTHIIYNEVDKQVKEIQIENLHPDAR